MSKTVPKKCEKCRSLVEEDKENCPSHRTKKNAGRKQFDGKSEKLVLAKLEQAFAQGCTDKEACIYTDISLDALYRYVGKNTQFRNRKQLLKEKPVLLARIEVVKGIRGDKEFAFKFLERKRRDEFGPHSTAIVDDGKGVLTEERKKEIATALANWEGGFIPKK